MIDTMSFPQTIEEFMEQYKVVDTEQVYSNGVEFVPIFRVKQWLEHSTKHGQWVSDISDGYENICSVCHHEYLDKCDNDSNYCPNCGAKMDEEDL